jgi:hypothetical protein
LVCGDNHLILGGPLPGPGCARVLAQRFGLLLVPLGALGPPPVAWSIRTKEFRENLTWAVELSSDSAPSAAVAQLLAELAARGVTIHRETEPWEGTLCD